MLAGSRQIAASIVAFDFNVEVTGFEMGEIDLRIATLDDSPEQAEDPADILPELPDRSQVSRVGDRWQIAPPAVGSFRSYPGSDVADMFDRCVRRLGVTEAA